MTAPDHVTNSFIKTPCHERGNGLDPALAAESNLERQLQ